MVMLIIFFFTKIDKIKARSAIRIIDGDTLILNKQKIRLKGIDAPEIKQQCTSNINNSKTKIRCGEVARQKLIELIGSSKVHCTNEGKDRYNRQAYCYAGNINLNREMVREGYAVACPKYDKSFVLDELHAKEAKRGIWSGRFEKPEE